MRTFVRSLRACVRVHVCLYVRESSICVATVQLIAHSSMNFLPTNSTYNTHDRGQLHTNELIAFKFERHLCASISNTGGNIRLKKNFKLHANVTARVAYCGMPCFRFFSQNNKQQSTFVSYTLIQVTLYWLFFKSTTHSNVLTVNFLLCDARKLSRLNHFWFGFVEHLKARWNNSMKLNSLKWE